MVAVEFVVTDPDVLLSSVPLDSPLRHGEPRRTADEISKRISDPCRFARRLIPCRHGHDSD